MLSAARGDLSLDIRASLQLPAPIHCRLCVVQYVACGALEAARIQHEFMRVLAIDN